MVFAALFCCGNRRGLRIKAYNPLCEKIPYLIFSNFKIKHRYEKQFNKIYIYAKLSQLRLDPKPRPDNK